MGTLKITYKITGFDRILYSCPPVWENCTFQMNEEDKATLCIWQEDVNDEESLKLARVELDRKLHSFILAMQHKLRLHLKYSIMEIQLPHIVKNGVIVHHLVSSIAISDNVTITVAPREPPDRIPQIPIECEPWIIALVEASTAFRNPEQQLRHQYITIEDLWREFESEFSSEEGEKKKTLKYVRHFVSHPMCNSKNVVKLISAELPSAYDDGNVKFDSNNIEHRNYIAKHAAIATDIACKLLEKKIAQIIKQLTKGKN